jgi:hypothetical protein
VTVTPVLWVAVGAAIGVLACAAVARWGRSLPPLF